MKLARVVPLGGVVAALVPMASGQGGQYDFQHRYGGTVVGTWVHEDPGHPGEFLVWTAEAGPRIRRVETHDGSSTFEEIIGAAQFGVVALHDVFFDPPLTHGLAVGSGGAGFWLSTPGTWRPVWGPTFFGAGAQPDLWESFLGDYGSGTVAWIAGTDGTLMRNPSYDTNKLAFAPCNLPAVPGTLLDVLSLGFADPATSGGSVVGVAGLAVEAPATGPVGGILYTTNGVDWLEANVERPAGFEPTPEGHYEVHVWDVAFLPGSQTMAVAVGGIAIGNGPGYSWYTLNGGQDWYALYAECDPDDPTGTAGCTPPNGVATGPGSCTTPSSPELTGTHIATEPATFYGVTVLPDSSAVAVAYGGGVWRFRPGGGSGGPGEWEDRADTTTFGTGPLWGCHSATAGDGTRAIWIGGQFGELRSSSDGLTWTQEAGGALSLARLPGTNAQPLMRLTDLCFVPSGGPDPIGWTVGQQARIAKTVDGGATWVDQHSYTWLNRSVELHAVHAYDASSAVAVGGLLQAEPGYPDVAVGVYYTTNGGDACGWTRVPFADLPAHPSSGVAVRDVRATGRVLSGGPEYWAVGDNRLFWRSDDGGATWTEVAFAGNSVIKASFDPQSIDFLTPDVAVVVGTRKTYEAFAYLTTDATSATPTWVDISPSWGIVDPASVLTLEGVAVDGTSLADAVVYAVGSRDGQGIVARMGPTDSELVLLTSLPAFTEELHNVEYVVDGGGSRVAAVGARGRVLTKDDADVWHVEESWTTATLRGVGMLSSTEGYVVGRNNYTGPPGPGVHTPTGWGDSTILRFVE